MSARLTFVHALSPLHAGTGQGAGIIDLPIAREKATGLPFLPGSSLKGTLRASCTSYSTPEECKQIFGPDASEIETNSNHASSIQLSDMHLLFLPIRSLAGTFAWVTSPYVLHRFVRDTRDAGITPPTADIPDIQKIDTCAITTTVLENEAALESKIKIEVKDAPKVYLEDLELDAQPLEAVGIWAIWIGKYVFSDDRIWQQMLVERLCIVHDDVFNFMIDTATEIIARIKLKEDAKTVQDGGLWYEEALPTETILSGIALATPTQASKISADTVFKVLDKLTEKPLQFGGNATVGRGLCRVQFAGINGQAQTDGGADNANS